ncbi:MAG TPA: tetratricopeptide repeat protein, partial [Polyangia bacterium]|nr:tetratricopeptide repeat protein [Polyangia bacterium]
MSAPKTPTGEVARDAKVNVNVDDERSLGHLATAGELVSGGRFREAEVEVLRALSGLPTDLRALNLLALVRIKLGRLEEARATYREIVSVAPNDATPRRHLGLLALKLERPAEAISDLEMAARLAPGDQQAWSYLGYAYAKTG